MRNQEMARRIEELDVEQQLRFAVAGDSGAWSDPTADAIYAQLVGQVHRTKPAFFREPRRFRRPEDRGAVFHFVELTVTPEGAISGRVVQAFADPSESRVAFGPA